MAFLQINGMDVPSPSELKVRLFDAGASEERSASGNLVVDRAAVKRELTLRWATLTGQQLQSLLAAVCEAVFFDATYPDPVTGQPRTMTCRCGERTLGMHRFADGAALWTNVEMKWTER